MVTESALRKLLEENGWYLSMIPRWNKKFAYAKKRDGKQVVTRYLKAESKLNELTAEEVLKRISK